ncbi:RsmD family RNA methyltransferase [Stomatohabitans albus]|uniref:RsmD family RNA methyltransferase n=1 Tax=Stomatohabitans albus TaxID=3110766 RepID=UPI00300CF4D8
MPRIIAGVAGGRPLKVPAAARPTADRVKEAIFSSIGPMDGAVVADLYGGSGGLAIEALSRGASGATCWESHSQAATIIAANVRTAQVGDRFQLIAKPCEKAPVHNPMGLFTHLFVDPPYDYPVTTIEQALNGLIAIGAVSEHAVLILERDKRRAGEMPTGWTLLRERIYGEALIRYGERLSSVNHTG